MPNWVRNSLKVIGNAADMKIFYEKSIVWENGKPIWRLSNTIPMPERLENTEYSLGGRRSEFVNQWDIEKAEREIAQDADVIMPEPIPCENSNEEKSRELIDLYGFDNWYEWRLNNWGVKWDCTTEGDHGSIGEQTETSFEIYFDSPWSPPAEWLFTMQEMFPALKFRLRCGEYALNLSFVFYTDESGKISWQKGEFIWVNRNGLKVDMRGEHWLFAGTNEPVHSWESDEMQCRSTLDDFHVWFEEKASPKETHKPYEALCRRIVQACNLRSFDLFGESELNFSIFQSSQELSGIFASNNIKNTKMKLTKERTPYLLMDFGEHHEANMVVLKIDDARDTFKKYQEFVAGFREQTDGIVRVQFNDEYSHYLKVDAEAYEFLSEWDRDDMFIDGPEEDIERFIEENDVIGGDGNYVTVYADGSMMLHIYDNHDYNRFDELHSGFFTDLL